MDTEAVRLFVLAADMLNISAAGRQLGLAQAVASARLSKLEKQVGADLLHRTTRKVSLSLEGAEFLPFAREILAQEDAFYAALGHGSNEIRGTLRFAAPSSFAQLFIAPIVGEFLERYPGINLQLKLSDTQMDLIDGAYDLALRNYAIEDSSLRARKLANDRRFLCASPDYLARHGTPRTLDDLQNHSLLVFMDGPARKLVSRDAEITGSFPPTKTENRIVVDDGTNMKVATLSGAGISMNSCWSVHRELRDGTLLQVLPDYEIADQSAIWLVYPKSNVLTGKVRAFIDFLTEKVGNPPIWER